MSEESDYASCGSANGMQNPPTVQGGKYDYESPVIIGPALGTAAVQQRAKADQQWATQLVSTDSMVLMQSPNVHSCGSRSSQGPRDKRRLPSNGTIIEQA